ncbi:MAG: hypothetical protein U0900_06050 [Myxococcota bacterium]
MSSSSAKVEAVPLNNVEQVGPQTDPEQGHFLDSGIGGGEKLA